jgi:hypothetical protein
MRDERTVATRSNSRVSLTRTQLALGYEHANTVPTRLQNCLPSSGRGDCGCVRGRGRTAGRRASRVESYESIEVLWRVEGEHGSARAPEDGKRLLLDVAFALESSLNAVALVDPRPLEQQGVNRRRTLGERSNRAAFRLCAQIPRVEETAPGGSA